MSKDNLIVPLFRVKEGGKFQSLNYKGVPEGPIYVKGRPHTIPWDICRTTNYVTRLYSPGEPAHMSFTGYVSCDAMVKVESVSDLKPKRPRKSNKPRNHNS